MQPLVKESIGEAPSEIQDTKPTQLLATDNVGGAEVSIGRQQIGEAPREIDETKPTQLPDTDDVGEAETSTGRQRDLSSKSENNKKEAWQFNQSKEDLGKLFKDKFNQFEDIEELERFLLDVKADLRTIREAKLKKAKKKWLGKKQQEGESEGESKLSSKGHASITDSAEVLQKISDIGVKPATASGNKVANESYNLLYEVLKGIGNLHWAAVGFSMVAFLLDRVKEVGDNSGKCLDLLETMCILGLYMVKAFPHLPQNEDLLWRMSTAITNGVFLCCRYKKSGGVSRFFFANVNKDDFESLSNKLKELSSQFQKAIGVANLEAVQEVRREIVSLSNKLAHLENQSETREAVQEVRREIESLSNKLTEAIRSNPAFPAHKPENTIKPGYGAFGNFQRLPHGMVRTDFVMEDIKAKLRDFRTVGLVGMGGVGKSTLAKAIFNELCPDFEYSCFVQNVKLKQVSVNDIKEEVLKLMHYKGKMVGDKLALSALDGKRLLLVFDDISNSTRGGEEEVLSIMRDVTAPESRFIVTSREEDLVKDLSGEPYRVPFLKKDVAVKLFKSLSFPGEEIAPETLQSHMTTIVEKCEGLPLTLTVLGKYLKDKRDEKFWRETLQALVKAEDVRNFTDRLWAKLRPSYEALGRQEQQIFLDAATFFNVKYSHDHTWLLGDAKAAWRAAYGTSVTLWWQTLVDFCLVYDVRDNEFIRVHEQLQCLGVKIAQEASNDGNCRVWDAKLGLQMLQSPDKMNGKTFHAFRARRLDLESDRDREDIHISNTGLSNLKQLHFFEARNRIIIDGAEEQGSVPSELVLLKCVGQNLFNPALQNRLTILHISALEYLPDSIGELSSLDQLKISKSPHLSFLPESFGRLSSLRRLQIKGCKSLQTLNDSFGGLSSLSHLGFQECGNLRTLPDSFGGLSSLSDLQFWDCDNLRTLPDSFRGLSSLSHLDFWGCKNLRTLPDSFGGLPSLSHLIFGYCRNLRTLPDSFGGLSSLSHLEFDWCENLRTLPDSFGALSSLSHLKFDGCENLRTLPDSFGGLSSLSHLEFWRCKKLRIVGGLSCVKHLRLDAESMPNSFRDLENLRYLEIWLKSASSIQDSIKSLPSLQTLILAFDGVGDTAYSLLPSWLKEPNAPASTGKYGRIEFQVQNGYFSLKDSKYYADGFAFMKDFVLDHGG